MIEKMTYEQQAQRINRLESKLSHVMEKEANLAATSSGIEEEHAALLKWAYDIYIGYRDVFGWIESETDPLVIGRPEVIRKIDEDNGRIR